MAVEKLCGIKPTPRCEYLRVILSEMNRITDHLTCVGAAVMELGAFSGFLYFVKAREVYYDLLESVTGARVT
jgi:NADH-quinone oxidoreductase subunit D